MRGGVITAVAQVVRIGLGLATIPILARLLGSDANKDYGLIGMVAVLTNFAQMFVNAGLSAATVQRDEVTRPQVTNLFWAATGLGLLVASVVAALAPAVSWFYGEPRLTAITIALAGSFAIAGLSIQHDALLRRGMQFRAISLITIASQVVAQIVGIGWAWQWYGTPHDYWALVLIPVTTAATRCVLTWIACPWRPGLPARNAGTREMIVFGANLTGFNFVNYFARNADNMLIGWWWEEGPLGFYERAYKLFLFPLQSINQPVSGVMTPALSRLNDNREQQVSSYLKVLRLLLYCTAPFIAAAAVTAEWWVEWILTPTFAPSAPIFRRLAIVGLVQPLANSAGWLFIAQGKSQEMFQQAMIVTPVTLLAFAIGLPWGPLGVATAYAIHGLAFGVPFLVYWMHRCDIIPAKSMLSTLWGTIPTMLATATANAALLMLAEGWPLWLQIAGSAAVSLLAWGIMTLVTPNGRAIGADLINLAKRRRAG